MPSSAKSENFFAWLAFGTMSFVWGTTYLAIAVAIETLPTFLFPALRFILGGIILMTIRLALGKSLPRGRSSWIYLAIIGTMMVSIGNVAVVFAEHHMSSGFAALLVATAPFSMAALELARSRGGQRLSGRKLAGTVIGFSGVVILVAPELQARFETAFLLSVVIVLVSSLAWNFGSILSKYNLPPDLDPIISASIQMIFGGISASIIGLGLGESFAFQFTARTLFAFIYLVIFGSVIAYGAYIYALSKLPTSIVTLHTYINPIVAVFLGWLVLAEPLKWNAVLAMMVIFSGVALVQKRSAPRAVVEPANDPA